MCSSVWGRASELVLENPHQFVQQLAGSVQTSDEDPLR